MTLYKTVHMLLLTKADLKSFQAFTICSSYYIHFIKTSTQFFEMMTKDGEIWFSLRVETLTRATHESNIGDQSDVLQLLYTNLITKERETELFPKEKEKLKGIRIPIIPHAWCHVCMGLDTVSGLLRIVVNGVEVVNEEKDYFRNTADMRPKSLVGKIRVFKEYMIGFYVQNRGKFTNMNIFDSLMSTTSMIQKTSSESGCLYSGDYLR